MISTSSASNCLSAPRRRMRPDRPDAIPPTHRPSSPNSYQYRVLSVSRTQREHSFAQTGKNANTGLGPFRAPSTSRLIQTTPTNLAPNAQLSARVHRGLLARDPPKSAGAKTKAPRRLTSLHCFPLPLPSATPNITLYRISCSACRTLAPRARAAANFDKSAHCLPRPHRLPVKQCKLYVISLFKTAQPHHLGAESLAARRARRTPVASSSPLALFRATKCPCIPSKNNVCAWIRAIPYVELSLRRRRGRCLGGRACLTDVPARPPPHTRRAHVRCLQTTHCNNRIQLTHSTLLHTTASEGGAQPADMPVAHARCNSATRSMTH